MPNTLFHFAAQGIASKAIRRDIDLKWVFLGCIVPDVPWILRRLVAIFLPAIDSLDLTMYAFVQASLIFCLVLSASLASLSRKPGLVFSILGLNSLLHLVLDAAQEKWANGVHFFAPFSWKLTNWGLVWPESPLVYVLTAIGLFLALWALVVRTAGIGLELASLRRWAFALLLLAVYFSAPVAVLSAPYQQNNQFAKTLREEDRRVGRAIELDRASVYVEDGRSLVRAYRGEELVLVHTPPLEPGSVSIRGEFVARDTIAVHEAHRHLAWFRDSASYLGLGLLTLIWLSSLIRSARESKLLGRPQV